LFLFIHFWGSLTAPGTHPPSFYEIQQLGHY